MKIPIHDGLFYKDELSNKRTAADILQEASDTYRERNAVYGDNFLRVGKMMEAMFPNGLTIKTAKDWNRIHMLLLTVIKQSRYATNWDKGGHQDSVRDATVYCAMLEMIDEMNE
jgi:hypothetical protein